MKQALFALFSGTLFLMACSTQTAPSEQEETTIAAELTLIDDSTLYGLACEGCTDSILIYIPSVGSDPDTIDILNARMQRRVFGLPDIGDQVAIMLSADNKDIANQVINIDRFLGTWCYQVTPRLRRHASASTDSIVQLPPNFPDSLRKKLFQPREYGFELRRNHTIRIIGRELRDSIHQRGPVEYPQLKHYRQWYICNGHILLCETRRNSLDKQQITSIDTADIVFLRRDTLQLRFRTHEQGYYRKTKLK